MGERVDSACVTGTTMYPPDPIHSRLVSTYYVVGVLYGSLEEHFR
jgi:hypothetical protein